MSLPDSSRQFTRLTYEALFARGAGLLGGFAANIMIARSLGAAGKGALAILTVWSGLLAALFSSGVHLAVVYELGRRPEQTRRLLSAVLPYVAGAIVAVIAVAFSFRAYIGPPGLSPAFLVALFAAQLSCHLAFAFLIGSHTQSVMNWLQVAGGLAYPLLVGAILFFRSSLDIATVTLCMIGLPAVMALVGFVSSQKAARRHPATGEPDFAWFPFLRYALKSTALAMGALLYSQIVILILSARGRAAQVGVFSVAMIFFDTVLVLPAVISSFVLPRWAGLPLAELSVRAGRVLRLTHPISLVIATGAALGATVLAGPVFGKDFAGVGTLTWIMVPGAWAATGIAVISNYFLAQNKHSPPLVMAWVGAVLSGALAWYGLPQLGCIGAAVVVSLSHLLVLMLAWYFLARTTRTAPQPIWIPRSDDLQVWGGIVRHALLWIGKRP